jgi:kynurenine formamidase
VKKSKFIYLSYILDKNTPTYGNRNIFGIEKKSSISDGDIANDSFIQTTVHIGTHIDMPYHFFIEGQTIEDFDCEYFNFQNVLFLEINSKELIVKDELIDKLKTIEKKDSYDIFILKTGICNKRNEEIFWRENYGFDSSIAKYLRKNFPNIRVFGFDSISVSSFAHRMLGREAHKAFLNPKKPILLLEDMDLTMLDKTSKIKSLNIVPLRIAKCDGLPCTILAEVK